MDKNKFEERLKACNIHFHPVVSFSATDKLLLLDFTEKNATLTPEILNNTNLFSEYIETQLQQAGATYGIGGYNEHRTIYSRSEVFNRTALPEAPPNLPEGEELKAQGQLMEEVNRDPDSLLGEREGEYGYQWADPFYYRQLKEFAAIHRLKPTQEEEILWHAMRRRQLGGYYFRRQFIIDRYIADFVCLDKRLIIEVDGLIHQLPENKENDQVRTHVLEEKGFTVIRFTNDEVLNHKERVLQAILLQLTQLPSRNELISPLNKRCGFSNTLLSAAS